MCVCVCVLYRGGYAKKQENPSIYLERETKVNWLAGWLAGWGEARGRRKEKERIEKELNRKERERKREKQKHKQTNKLITATFERWGGE